MCGIGAAIDWDGAEAAVRTLIAGLAHRGDITDPIAAPGPNTALCTRRLRVVDADHGAQPKLSSDGRVLVSFNGEIYNHAALRRELTALGCRFETESDTEVLANALSVWGSRALGRLNGMYAFVAVDLANGDFVAARDPLGVKPLYVVQSGAGFLFCSEIRPLLQVAETGDVLLLPPGHLLTKQHFGPFENIFSAPFGPTLAEPAELDRILAQAVHIRVPPDLPFAVMFSGGIDSTLVAHYARQLRPEAPGYFLGGPEAPDYAYAAAYAERTGLDFRTVPLPDEGAEMAVLIDQTIRATEAFEPCIVRPSLCNYVLARQIHQDGFRVTLCGEGADELFAGYAPLELTFAANEAVGRDARNQYLSDMNRGNLQRLDRCTMRFELEAREPFLDPAVIAYAMGCGGDQLVSRVAGEPRGKAPLRALFDLYPDALPSSIRDRMKVPFNEGAGYDESRTRSPWRRIAEAALSDADFRDGVRQFADFALNDKEELFNLLKLSETLDVTRVPHLKGRIQLHVPAFEGVEKLRGDLVPAQ
jgi:asparagine synthase (glutamine-hydrolysing)